MHVKYEEPVCHFVFIAMYNRCCCRLFTKNVKICIWEAKQSTQANYRSVPLEFVCCRKTKTVESSADISMPSLMECRCFVYNYVATALNMLNVGDFRHSVLLHVVRRARRHGLLLLSI